MSIHLVNLKKYLHNITPFSHIILLISLLVVSVLFYSSPVSGGPYLDSAHGDTTDGVNRTSMSAHGYSIGHCAHCHEQHASVGGTEPVPAGGAASKYLCYQQAFNTQAGGFCMSCHRDSAGQQVGGYVYNEDYSERRGKESKDCPESIREAFRFINKNSRVPQNNCGSSAGSAHDLADIVEHALKNNWGWGYFTAKINPCLGCHNPHRATEEYPCSLPSGHSNKATWEIWGDDPGEKMADYLGAGEVYQPPFKVGKTTHERDASTQPNYVELCLECHKDQLASSQHGTVGAFFFGGIEWDGITMHGSGHGLHELGSLNLPYDDEDKNYVLCCTDCHEPHGSSNQWLLRTEVNGKDDITMRWDGDFFEFCTACHKDLSGHALDEFEAGRSCYDMNCHTHGFGRASL